MRFGPIVREQATEHHAKNLANDLQWPESSGLGNVANQKSASLPRADDLGRLHFKA